MICRRCGHSQLDDIVPPIFTNPTTELTYIDEQIDQINSQIVRLKELQSTLRRRSNHLRSPIYAIPIEVVSQIFQQLCNSRQSYVGRTGWESTPLSIHCDAITLSAVSSHWRQIAFATPRLWERMRFWLHPPRVNSGSAWLQYCASHVQFLDISVVGYDHDAIWRWDPLEQIIHPITKVLFSPDIARKVKALSLAHSPLHDWIPMLPSFPLLNSLALRDVLTPENTSSLDLQTFPLFRVCLEDIRFISVSLPASVQVLHLYNVRSRISMDLLRQCPNLVECINDIGSYTIHEVSFTTHLALNHLKTLAWPLTEGLSDAASIHNLQMPVLEHLKLEYTWEHTSQASGAITLLCHQLSTTLLSLTLVSFRVGWTFNILREVFKLSLHNLRILKLESWSIISLLEAIRLLTPSEDEYNNHEIKYLPSLKSLTLTASTDGITSGYHPFSRLLLDLLERRRAGETFRFHLNFSVPEERGWVDEDDIWPPELQEELRMIVNNCQIDVERASKRIGWL